MLLDCAAEFKEVLRVARVAHITTSLDDGGAERTLFKLCTGDKVHHHSVISLSGEEKYADELRRRGITVHTLDLKRGIDFGKIRELIDVLRATCPDVIQTWMPHANLVGSIGATFSGFIPVVWNLRTTNYGGRGSNFTTKLIVRILALLSWVVPGAIIACSYSALESHTRMGFQGRKIVVVQNGFEPEFPVSDDLVDPRVRDFLQASGDVIKFAMVGRFHPEKGQRELIESLSMLKNLGKDFSCVLVGKISEPNKEDLQRALKDCSLDKEVLIAGPLKNVGPLYSRIDVHISVSSNEGFPNVVAESMLYGKPNIVTDVGESRTIVGDSGWVINPNSPSELLEALVSSCEASAEEMSLRSNEARKRILELFSLTRMIESYIEVYSQLIEYPSGLAE